jgi:hypothetical protein
LTLQVKYLANCVEKLIQGQTNNDEPYGVPGPSRVGGSQEEPIIISDDDITIKIETNIETISNADKKAKGKGKEPVCPTAPSSKGKEPVCSTAPSSKGKEPVCPTAPSSPSSSNSSPSSSSDSSLCSSGRGSKSDGSRSSNTLFYLKKSDMPKDLRESLRVNRNITN